MAERGNRSIDQNPIQIPRTYAGLAISMQESVVYTVMRLHDKAKWRTALGYDGDSPADTQSRTTSYQTLKANP